MSRSNNYSQQILSEQIDDLENRLAVKKTDIANHWSELTSTSQPESKVQSWMNQVERGFALYDGIMTGYKIFRRFNHFINIFSKKKKK